MDNILSTNISILFNKRSVLFVTGVTGLAAMLFLILFEPFTIGFEQGDWIGYFMALGYVIPAAVILLISEYVLKPVLISVRKIEKWKIWQAVLWYSGILFPIAFCNSMYYSYRLGYPDFFYTEIFMLFIYRTFLSALLLSLVVIPLYRMYGLLKKGRVSAYFELEEQPEDQLQILLYSENRKEHIKLDVSDILFIEGADNYVWVHKKTEAGDKRLLLRNTLKNIQKQLSNSKNFARCHRSFIVNLDHVMTKKGNSRSMKLILQTDQELPVSKTYTSIIDARLSVSIDPS